MLGKGMMVPQPQAISFRASATTSASATISKPAGVAVGDLVIITATDPTSLGNISTASGDTWTANEIIWTTSGLGYKSRIWWKFLNATDVANSWTHSGGAKDFGAVAWIATGASAVVVKSTTNGAGSTTSFDLAGYTTAVSRGTISVISDRDASAATVPSGFTSRFAAVLNTSWWQGIAARNFGNPVATGTVTWTVASPNPEVGWLLDVI